MASAAASTAAETAIRGGGGDVVVVVSDVSYFTINMESITQVFCHGKYARSPCTISKRYSVHGALRQLELIKLFIAVAFVVVVTSMPYSQ